jgi:hypothetical protein
MLGNDKKSHPNIVRLVETRIVSAEEKYFVVQNVNSSSKNLGDVIRELKGTGKTMPHLSKICFIKWAQ